jgi:hypothetical protein
LARAKRTDRTEARRRHRAEQAAQTADPATADEPSATDDHAASAPGRSTSKSRSSKPSGGAPARPGLAAAFRGASRPLDWREDLRYLPTLVRHWSLLVPVGASIVSSVLWLSVIASASDPSNPPAGTFAAIAYVLYQFFVFPPPIAGAFLAGLGAPRASWLIGAIVGVVAAIGQTVIVLVAASKTSDQSVVPFIVQGFLIAPFGAALFASLGAWYKRFLNLANPNRSQRPAKASRGRGDMPTNSRATASRRP